ncbi:60S ribosomal subunit assembly/export protein [Orbilia ellipsospora]|uniref:60S ribosomal subunit assembly/export protein n=1 Tax=Orbilia ellipsospora TaxID=2528407 RepID=A0AAV9XJ27_9PEZI
MAPVKRTRTASASKTSSSKKRKLNNSSSTTDPKPFTPGQITSSKRHKKKTTIGPSSTTTTNTKSSSSSSRIRKPHKKPVKERYTDAQLKLPTLNGIIPAGVTKPRGKKKGKVFVEDKETMMGILELVNESVDGVIQGKVERNRRLEVVRQQKRAEQEKKEREKEAKLENVKDSLRKKRKRKTNGDANDDVEDGKPAAGGRKKKVSFA